MSSNNKYSAGLLEGGGTKLENLLTNNEFPSIAKELVHPGDNPMDLLMRCNFDNDREAKAAAMYLAKCKEFGDKEGESLLLMLLAAKTSIKGRRTTEFLQAITGQLLRPQPENNKGKKREDGAL